MIVMVVAIVSLEQKQMLLASSVLFVGERSIVVSILRRSNFNGLRSLYARRES